MSGSFPFSSAPQPFRRSHMTRYPRSGRKTAFHLLLGLALVLIPTSQASAQDAAAVFNRGMAHYHNGNYEAAQAAFREVVSLAPEQVEAYALLNESQDALLELMVAGGEFESFAREILASAATTSREAVRDLDAAADETEGCFDDSYEVRAQTIFSLTMKYGPFASVALIKELASQKESRRLAALYALTRMGSEITQPLLAATWSSNADVRSGAALALGQMGDPRAMARLTDMATRDESGAVRVLAGKLARPGQAAEMYLAQGWAYLLNDSVMGLSSAENYGASWVTDGVGVMPIDMPESLVGLEAAKRCFLRASELGNPSASIGLAQAYAAEITVLQGLIADGNDDLESVMIAQSTSALTLPLTVLEAGLVEATKRKAIGTARTLVGLLDGGSSTSIEALKTALREGTPSLRYAAAQALAGFGVADPGVVNALAEAASMDALRVVHLMDDQDRRAMDLSEGLTSFGIAVIRSTDAAGGYINMHRSVMVDAFVIADPLPDFFARRVVAEIRKDARFADTPISVIGNKNTGDIDGAEVVGSVSASDIVDGFGPLGAEREGYLATAAAAASSLAKMAGDHTEAVRPVVTVMAGIIGREDAVSIPAMFILGRAGAKPEVASLVAVLGESSRSKEARVAAAKALAILVDRTGASVPVEVIESAMSEGHVELARACARILGAAGEAHRPALVVPE